MKADKVLVLSPHADDAEICAGGFISKLVEEGSKVWSVVVARTSERREEVKEAAKVLGFQKCFLFGHPIRNLGAHRQEILDRLLKIKEEVKPDLVIQPSLNDFHQDHRTVAEEGLRAYKDCNLIGYEAIWNNLDFDAEMFVRLSGKQLENKIKAVLCYKSQSDKRYIDSQYITALAIVRGVQIGYRYAEAYTVIRQVIK